MVRFLLRLAVFLGSAAIGLFVASLLVSGVSMRLSGFILAVVIFAVVQALMAPLFTKMADLYASALLGGIGLASTLVALILATVLTDGLTIQGLGSWVAATVVVWLVTALATILLPKLLPAEEASGSS